MPTRTTESSTPVRRATSDSRPAAVDDRRPINEAFKELKELADQSPQPLAQLKAMSAPPPSTGGGSSGGLPPSLRSGIESLSGISMGHVRVHYDSPFPARLQALAYAQGNQIHLGPGQERHLPHEAWHVVQQAQGRVKPTVQRKEGLPINDEKGLEREADEMGAAALRIRPAAEPTMPSVVPMRAPVVQRSVDEVAPVASILRTQGLTGSVLSTWSSILSALDAYGALSNDDYTARKTQLAKLVGLVLSWKTDYMKMSESAQNELTNKTKYEMVTRGLVAASLDAETRELDVAMSGSLRAGGLAVATVSPSLTKTKNDAYIEKDMELFSDRALTKRLKDAEMIEKRAELKLSVAAIPCTVLGDYKSVKQIEFYATKTVTEAGTAYTDRVVAWIPASNIMDSMDVIVASQSLTYAPTDGPLFPKKPTKDDVIQGGLGDCYLLAALISVADANPDFFQTIMRDDGRDVTVKLFDVNHRTEPHTFAARYIKVPKSKVVDRQSGQDAFAKGSLWVQILEKAFVAAGFTGVFEKAAFDPTADGGGYAGIESGHIDVAFEHLTGKAAKQVEVKTRREEANSHLRGSGFHELPWSAKEQAEYARIPSITVDAYRLKAYFDLTSYAMLDRSIANVDAWMTWLSGRDLIGGIMARAKKGVESYTPEIRLDDVAAYFKAEGLNQTVADLAMTWLEQYKVFPGKRGTGKYTAEQLDLFDDIVVALGNEEYVGVGSNKDISRGDPSAVGFSGGEPVAKGLVGRHAYAVLDFGYGPAHNKDADSGKQRWVFLQNPWQQYGRKYGPDGSASDNSTLFNSKGVGGFWLELADLTKRFNSLYLGSR